ncbi:MAG: hydrogenase maturation nickel metallochaperone HypA [Pirellulales bacterium]|nr:hydrogenase maturation nickel metallochaperone HypA [Pirellulales bacterium]
MHERSLIRSLLRQVEKIAAEHPASRVVAVRVRVGEFSGVEPELLELAYKDLVEETPIRGAALQMERVPLEAECRQCGHHFRIEHYNFQCTRCGSLWLRLQNGEELVIDSVTFEECEP